MPTQLNDEVFVVYYSLLEWEDTNALQLYTGFFDHEDIMLLLMKIAHSIKHDSPPDMVLNPNDWALFILDDFIEYAGETGINNITAIIKIPDRVIIADKVEVILGLGAEHYPTNFLASSQVLINRLLEGSPI